jgi:hypothetical protein
LRITRWCFFRGCILAAAVLLAVTRQTAAGESSFDVVSEGDVYLGLGEATARVVLSRALWLTSRIRLDARAGAEIEMTPQLRVEPYYARQEDQRSAPAHLNRIGLVVKVHL